jgi:AraC family transcriptional regulator, transcriptional activator of the genes for pyochelin and ferripyochelin receptors
MAFEMRNNTDQSIIHQNTNKVEDFNTNQLVEGFKNFELPFGKGSFQQWYFDGIRLGYSNWEYTDYVTMDWKGDLDIVTLYFNIKGRTTMGNDMVAPISFGNHQHNLFYSSVGEGTMKNDELKLTTFMVQFSKEAFLRITQDGNDLLKRFAEHVIEGKSLFLSDHHLQMDVNMLSIIKAILNCKYDEGIKKLFLISKTIELLVLQAESYNQLLKNKSDLFVKTDYDKERLLFAKEYMTIHFENPPSLTELSRIIGLNEYKLKRGFKEMFGTTVFGYLSETRLDMAKESLLNNSKTISLLAFELGYSSTQHFSTAFKKRFGVAPSMLKK